MLLLKARFNQSNRARISSAHFTSRAMRAFFHVVIPAQNADALCEFGGHRVSDTAESCNLKRYRTALPERISGRPEMDEVVMYLG